MIFVSKYLSIPKISRHLISAWVITWSPRGLQRELWRKAAGWGAGWRSANVFSEQDVLEKTKGTPGSLKHPLWYFQATTFPLKITEAPRLSFGRIPILHVVLYLQDLHQSKENPQGCPRPKEETWEPNRCQYSLQCILLHQSEETGIGKGKAEEPARKLYKKDIMTCWRSFGLWQREPTWCYLLTSRTIRRIVNRAQHRRMANLWPKSQFSIVSLLFKEEKPGLLIRLCFIVKWLGVFADKGLQYP